MKNGTLELMMKKHAGIVDANSAKNVIKQIVQEIVLCALGRTDFFEKASFNGGTALRIFHELPRFSEDLDFSVDEEYAEGFSFDEYAKAIDNELESLGIPAIFAVEQAKGLVERGYVRGNCRELFQAFELDDSLQHMVPANEVLKIKVEADTAILHHASFETKYLLKPYPSAIRIYDRGSLFAGKLAAVICRNWKNRVKGRDLYDYLFYIAENYPLNMDHLKSRLVYGGAISEEEELSDERLKELLKERFASIDYDDAKADIRPFIANGKEIDIWSPELFIAVTEDVRFTDE